MLFKSFWLCWFNILVNQLRLHSECKEPLISSYFNESEHQDNLTRQVKLAQEDQKYQEEACLPKVLSLASCPDQDLMQSVPCAAVCEVARVEEVTRVFLH